MGIVPALCNMSLVRKNSLSLQKYAIIKITNFEGVIMNKLIKSLITGILFGILFWGFCVGFISLIYLSDTLVDIYDFCFARFRQPIVFPIILYAFLASLIIIKAVKFPETWWQLIIFAISSILSSQIVAVIWYFFESDGIGITIVFEGSCTATLISAVCQLAIFLFKRLRRLG